MFKTLEKKETEQISITGSRAIVIIGLLTIMPRTFEEIKQELINYKVLDEDSTDDIVKIDLNTVKAIGCEISKQNTHNSYKYVLEKNPLSMNITQEEIQVLKKAYNILKQSNNIQLLLNYDALFKKLADYVYDSEAKEALLGISVLKYIDTNLIRDLILFCNKKSLIKFVYYTPATQKESVKEGIAQKVYFQNDKVYLSLNDFDKKNLITYNVKRIKAIISQSLFKGNEVNNHYKVLYYLKNINTDELLENEKIVEYNEQGYLVEATFSNDFWAAQRVLNFGSKCTVVEPAEFRDKIISKLKETRKFYE